MGVNSPLNVACSGTGYFSQFHYEAWTRLHQVNLVGVCNRTLTHAEAFAKKYDIPLFDDDLRRLLEQCKPDLVDIITPPVTHLSAVKIAAELGIDVVCQKPFGETILQAQAMVAIAKEAGIKLIVHENFRFMPWYRKIKLLLNNGELGEVLNAEFKLRPGDGQGPEAYLTRQPYFQKMPKFLVHETAIHLVDTFRFLFGEPRSVYAQLRRCNPAIKGEDAGIIVFDFPKSIQAVFDGNRLLDHSATNTRRTMGELEIIGTQAELRLDGEAKLWLRRFGKQTRSEITFDWNDQNFGGDCVFETIQHIVQHFCSDTPLENQGFEYMKNILIENAIYTSSEEGRKMDLML